MLKEAISESEAQADRVAAVVLLHKDGSMLLQLRDDKPGLRDAGKWVPPGGHCEPGESMKECAWREFLEETDYRCDQLEWLMSTRCDPDGTFGSYRLEIYWAIYDGVQPVTCREGQELRFVHRSELSRLPVLSFLADVWDRALAAASQRTSLSDITL